MQRLCTCTFMNHIRFIMSITFCMLVFTAFAGGSYSLNVGESIRLTFTPKDGVLTNTIRWESNAPTYLEVESSIGCTATIRALKPFSSRIIVQCSYEYVKYNNGYPYAITAREDFYITINEVKPTSISLPSNITMTVDSYRTLTPTIYPANATTTLTWQSNGSAASVWQDGTVYAVTEGSATVIVSTDNGLSAYCNEIVRYAKPTGISLSPSTLYLPIGESKKLSYIVTPSNAQTSVTWSLDDGEGIVSLDDNGTVTALSEGTAVVKVRTDNGYSGTCKITVPPMPEKISIPKKISLMYGTSRVLDVTPQPTDAYLNLSWKSSDNSIVSVTSDGKVMARKPGAVDVTVTASNGVSSTCRVEVEAPVFNFIVWTGEDEKTVYPLAEKPIVTFSDKSIIVKTSSKQIEYAKERVLRFTMEDGSVIRMPESIEMVNWIELAYKQKAQLEYTLYPTDYDIETGLTWASDNTDVVRVNQSGEIYACGVGTAVVTVTAENGCTASCTVMVPEPEFYFVVWLEDGGFVAYPFEEHPQVTYNDGLLKITTDMRELNIESKKVKEFTINDTIPDDILTIMDENSVSRNNVRHGNDFVSFVGCSADMDVCVYTISGALVKQAKTDSEGMLYLSLEDLDSGVYIIKSEEITCKILKK